MVPSAPYNIRVLKLIQIKSPEFQLNSYFSYKKEFNDILTFHSQFNLSIFRQTGLIFNRILIFN